MATPLVITMNLESNAAEQMRQLTASITASLAGIDAKMQDTAQKTGQAAGAFGTNAAKMAAGMAPLAKEIRVAAFGANDLGAAFIKTGQAAGATTAQLRPLAGAYGAVGDAAKKAADDTAKANQHWTQAGTLIPRLGAAFSSFNTILRSTAVQVAAGLGITAGITGLIQMGKSLVEAGLQMERFERTLQAATGSSRGAQQAFQFITAESNRLGQSITEMVPIFVQLTAATRNTVLEGERTRELFSALAGAGQAVGLSTEAVGGAMLGLTQIISQNAIQLDEFRTQFASRIPGAMLETAKALKTLGVTQRGTIAEMLQGFNRGRISVDDLTKAVTMGLREIQRTAPEMANSVQAAFNQLSNAVFQLMADIAKSGLLDVLARIARFVGREAQGLGRALNIANISDIEQLQRLNQDLAATIKLRDEAQRKSQDPSTLQTVIEGLGATTLTQQVKDYNAELTLTQAKIDALTQSVNARQKADAEAEKARSDRVNEENRQNKALEDAEKRRREGAQDSAARARANVGLTQERVNQEKIAQEQMQALREQALERDYTAAVANTEQTKAAQEAIETAFAIRRLDISRATALEAATLEEQAAIQGRDARIAAIKAADAAAQASAAGPGATAEAQVNANKRSAASTLELQTVNLAAQNAIQAAVQKRTEAEADYEKGVSAVIRGERADQIKITEQTIQREAELRQQALQGQASIISAETELVAAQVDGLILTREEGIARTQALEVQALTNRRALLEEQFQEELRQMERRVAANEATEADIAAIRSRHTQDVQAIHVQEQTLAQTHRNQLLEGWIAWVKDVKGALGNFLFDWMNGEVDSIKDVLDGLKSYFFRLIADMVAYAATRAIVVPIVGAVLGGIGGVGGAAGAAGAAAQLFGGGGGDGGGGGMLQTGLGVLGLGNQLNSLFGESSPLATGISYLTRQVWGVINGFDAMLQGTDALTASMESAAFAEVSGGALGTSAAPGLSPTLGIAGGLAAIGTGIYAALNASNTASRAAFAASAAAGAAAAASTAVATAVSSGLLTASAGTAALTGWTGIGLIVAAVMAVIGTVLDKVIKPEGPTVAVGAPGGLNVGAADGRLQLRGDAGSRIFRREGVDPSLARGVQAQLEEGITNAAIAAIDTINAVALDPEALLGPTQAALQAALKNVATINSSNAKKMEQDLSEQLRFANIQMVGGLLEPINRAFDQLRDMGDLEEQISQLPAKTAGLIAIFTNLRTQLDEIGASRNTDVLRQLSAVRNQVENFGNRIAGTAAQVAESIVTQTIEAMQVDVAPKLADQITQFAGLMDESFRALNTLRATKTMLEGAGLPGGGVGSQADRLTMAMSEQAGRISTAIVTGALDDLKTELNQVLVQPIAIQATTINSLFTDSLAALNALFKEWHRLEEAGLDATAVQGQFERLLGGVLEGTFTAIREAFDPNAFNDFLAVVLAIPPELAKMNPELDRLRTIATAFATVSGPNAQRIAALESQLRTPAETAAATAKQMADLRAAIADAGDSADKALPLYGQLSAAVVANAEAQIAAIQEIAQAWHAAMDQVESDIVTFEDALGGMGTQLTRAIVDMRVGADAFNQAVASGDTLGAIEAIHEYEQAVVEVAELQIQAIQEIAQAWHSAMDQVTSDIDALEEELHGVGTQLTNAIIDMRVNADAFNQAVARGDTLGAIEAIHEYEQAVIAVGNLQIRQIEEQRQAAIDAQQDIIDGLQRQADAQQAVIDGIDQQIEAQQTVVDAWQAIIDYRQEELTALREIESAADARVQSLRQEEQALRSLRDRVDDLTRASLPPSQQPQVIRAEIARTQAQLPGATGEDAIRHLERLVSLNEELMQLGEQTDNLALVKEGMDNLRGLQVELNKRLAEQTTELDLAFKQWDEARLTRIAAEGQLKTLQERLKYEEHVRKNLEERKKYEEHVLGNIEDQKKYQEDVLRNIENSAYWDEQIAAVQVSVLDELYKVRLWLAGVQGPTTWEQQITAIQVGVLDELYKVRLWLAGINGETSWEQQIKDIQWAALLALHAIQLDLANLFRIAVGASPIFAQRGGIVGLASGLHYAQGGMVPAMLEPGERVMTGPFSMAQQGALMAMNQSFPRFANGGFTVPGSGAGDSVPAWLPSGSFVMNRSASRAMGAQGGGMVPSHGTSPAMPPIVIDLRGSTFGSVADAHKVRDILEKDVIRIMEEYQKKVRVNTRIR